MIVTVDLAAVPAVVALDDPGDIGRFHVAVRGGADLVTLAAALAAAGASQVVGGPVGDLGDAHVDIDVSWLRARAAGRVEAGWEAGFAEMLAYAATKGWLAEDGATIRGHVEPS